MSRRCLWCGESVEVGDRIEVLANGEMHFECAVRSSAGSLGHQRRLCSCYGGTTEDPPGVTRRQAARAAALEFFMGNRSERHD